MELLKTIDMQAWITALTFVGAAATLLALLLPLLRRDERSRRLKALKQRREQLRQETQRQLERRKAEARGPKKHVTLMRKVLDRLRLGHLVSSRSLQQRLSAAGYRQPQAPVVYVFVQVVAPFVFAGVALLLIGLAREAPSTGMQILIVGGLTAAGLLLPWILLKNAADKRRAEITLFFPDALDLLVICTEAGLSVDAAFARVTEELAETSPVLAQELSITAAEQAFLGDRRKAYMNLAERTGVPAARALATSLAQAEKYGTPVSQALKVLSQENREERLSRAERKAAALPAQLTVPMIIFFLPVLLVVIIGPAIIQVFKTF
ncbi:type II secretion system F family protein [Caenispirillum salinarum]|uniref:type II secretion system F family protein n=1 Tax=Caenispirillum salinarum TaxID=859058 RepID=UPI00384B3FF9